MLFHNVNITIICVLLYTHLKTFSRLFFNYFSHADALNSSSNSTNMFTTNSGINFAAA